MAGLIPQTFIDDLLNRTDIVEVIDKRVALKKTGKNYLQKKLSKAQNFKKRYGK